MYKPQRSLAYILHSTLVLSLFLHCVPFLAPLSADTLRGSILITAQRVAVRVAADQPTSLGRLSAESHSTAAANANLSQTRAE